MTSLVCTLAGLLAAPSDYDSVDAIPSGEVEIVIPIDTALVAALESGDEVVGEIPPHGRRATQYRLRFSSRGQGASQADSSSTDSGDAGQLELLIPVEASLLSRLSAGSEVIGEIPASAQGAVRYRLQLARTPTLAESSARPLAEARSAVSSPSATAGTYENDTYAQDGHEVADGHTGTSGLPLPGPTRTNLQPPAEIDAPPSASSLLEPPGTTDGWAAQGVGPYSTTTESASTSPAWRNQLAPVVESATDLVSNTVAAAKSILKLPPPPSESATLRSGYQTTPQVSGILDLPPPPGTYSSQIPTYDTPAQRVATTGITPPSASTGATPPEATPPEATPPETTSPVPYTPPNDGRSNLVAVPAGPRAPAHQPAPTDEQGALSIEEPVPAAPSSKATEKTEEAGDVAITTEHPRDVNTSPATSRLAPPGTDVEVPDKEDIDLADAANAQPATSRLWTMLSFSLLGLCISIGGNFFLGWIAWDHRGRYLDLLRKTRRERARA